MFSLKREALMLSLRPADAFRPIPPATDRRVWDAIGADLRGELCLRADQALREPLVPLTASMYLQGAPYIERHQARIEQLKALILGACAGGTHYLERIRDLLWALTEQSDWALPTDASELPAPLSPRVDLAACEVASVLALAHSLLGAALDAASPAIRARIRHELDWRVFAPLADESRPLDILFAEIPRAADALMSAVLLLESDDRLRWLCMRRLLGLLERHLQSALRDGGCRDGLERHLQNTFALSNCLFMISLASGGEVELRDEPEFVNMAMLPVALHIGGGWFVNPGGDGPRPAIDAQSLFRLGDSVRSGELCALAAYLNRPGVGTKAPGGSLMHQLLNALYYRDFLKEPARVALRPSVCLPDMQLLSARMGEFFVALIGGENRHGEGHLDVSDVCLFYKGKPVLIDPGAEPGAEFHSVPKLELTEQGYLNQPPQEGVDFQFDPSYVMLSLGIAHAYPRGAGLQSWQRSLMMTSFEGNIRLMDVIDFDHGLKKQLSFRFITPLKPEDMTDRIQLGDIELTWEGELDYRIEPVKLDRPEQRMLWGGAFHRITFSTPGPVQGGSFGFVFRPAGLQ